MYVKATVDAENVWTDSIIVPYGHDRWGRGTFNVSLKPSDAIMTITLQRKYAEEDSWGHDVKSWTLTADSPHHEFISEFPEPEQVEYRIGCATGNYTSGSCTARLGLGV